MKLTHCRVCAIAHESHWRLKTLCPACDIRASGVRTTEMQAVGLLTLLDESATSKERCHYGPDIKPLVMGKLRDAGLVESRVVTKSRSQRTHYWLTPIGAEVARRLK